MRRALAGSLIAVLALSQAGAAIPDLRWKTNSSSTQISVEVVGLPQFALEQLQRAAWPASEWQKLFAVYAADDSNVSEANLPPMLGTYVVGSDLIRFQPKFPLERGVTYQAIFRPANLPDNAGNNPPATNLISKFHLPFPHNTPTTVITHVYPTSDVLPSNLLKFYIYFSAPMSRGRIYDHIRLDDDTGKAVEQPFLEIDEELWNPEMTRLTLLLDPGRIKRGVLPLEQIGPALYENKSYSLVIDRDWQDAQGNALKEGHHKSFKTSPPDREAIDTSSWKITVPPAGSLAPLRILFPKPLDQALALRMIQVADSSGQIVAGQASLAGNEQQWKFTPSKAWTRGSCRIVIQTSIEDLAGNNIGKPFEVDLLEGIQRRLSHETVSLDFRVE